MPELLREVLKDGDDECGTIVVSIAEKDSTGKVQPPDVDEGAHVFEFLPAKKEEEKPADKNKGERKEGSDDCCGGKGFGWIQHVSNNGVNWKYDNGAFRPPLFGSGSGAASDSDVSPQPSENDRPTDSAGKPVQSTGDNRWKENPWYGAPTDPSADRDDFQKNPQPQTKIGDKPGGSDSFRTQLVCAYGGKVWFVWQWTSTEKGKKRPPPKSK